MSSAACRVLLRRTRLRRFTKRFISETCAGYYAKLNTNCKPMKDKTSFAVLYAYRPWSGHFGEPQLAVRR